MNREEIISDNELKLHRLELENGRVDMSLSGEHAKIFMAGLVQFFKQNHGENFLTVECNDHENKYEIIINNLKGVTSATKQLTTLKQENEQLKEALRTCYRIASSNKHNFLEQQELEEVEHLLKEE